VAWQIENGVLEKIHASRLHIVSGGVELLARAETAAAFDWQWRIIPMKRLFLASALAMLGIGLAGCCGESRLANRQCSPCSPCGGGCGCRSAVVPGATIVSPGPDGFSFIPKQ
jgi:hypothetical protein